MRVEYRCFDGTPFPVEFADPADAERRWLIDREHAPTARTPLAEAVNRRGRAGTERAYAVSGLAVPSTMQHEAPRANGYDYVVEFVLPEAERDAFAAGLRALDDLHGGTAGVWAEHCLPRVQEACALLESFRPETPFATLAEWRAYALSLTAIAGAQARRDERSVAAMCEPVFGDRATDVAYQLAQGFASETLSADRAIRRIARLGFGADGSRARAEFLKRYGTRSSSWTIDHPTFAERPELLDAQLRLVARNDAIDDEALEIAARRRRDALVEQVMASLEGDDDRTRFGRRLARLEAFVPVREARAHWQLVATGAMRHVVRDRGRHLVERDVIDEVDDVFFLRPEEYDDPHGELRRLVAERRTDHAHWSAMTPPPAIGSSRPDGSDRATADDAPLRGIPGAPGVARGTARVILDLVDAERLEPGDILVTTMTSPPWTPLFGLAAAVVTDSGDALSHVAIAAREYGIPCVVATDHATAAIPDGAVIVVDGDAGSVRLDG